MVRCRHRRRARSPARGANAAAARHSAPHPRAVERQAAGRQRDMTIDVTLIIPALNEAECIGPLLGELPAGLAQQVLVVDNGSTDDTAGAARRAGAEVVREPRRGYGYAC